MTNLRSQSATSKEGVLEARAERRILLRGQRVMLDSDLAELYGVTSGALLQAAKRNPRRFSDEFLFRLSPEEFRVLTSHSVISKGRGGRRHEPYAFTEPGGVSEEEWTFELPDDVDPGEIPF